MTGEFLSAFKAAVACGDGAVVDFILIISAVRATAGWRRGSAACAHVGGGGVWDVGVGHIVTVEFEAQWECDVRWDGGAELGYRDCDIISLDGSFEGIQSMVEGR